MKKSFVLFLTTILLVAGITGCSFISNVPASQGKTAPVAEAKHTVHMSVSLAAYTLEKLLSEAPVIVQGEITGISGAFKIMTVYGGESIFTDYYLEPYSILRGDNIIADSDSLTIRIEGGETDDVELLSDGMPVLEKGKTYTLFLYKPNMGGGFNTKGDYYYVMGSKQGAFLLEGDSLTPQSNNIEPLTTEALANLARSMTAPISEDATRIQFEENCKSNLETGFITEEEYERWMAEIEEYAEIVETK